MIARLAAFLALVAAVVLVGVLLFGNGEGYSYRLHFENAGQLVPGNQVRVAGHVVGTVNSVDLNDDFQAEIKITVDEPLHQGSRAVVRSTSLSGVANRYVSVMPGPTDGPELANDSVMDQRLTTSAVDLDQLFDTFTPKTRRALSNVLKGQATVYAGVGEEANETYRYFGPALQATTSLLAELTTDQAVLTDFLVETGRVLTAVGQRREALSSGIANANEALGAIAVENASLDAALVALPPALRQANTTFVNLRAALDDLDPLVETAIPATADLAPFLNELGPVAESSEPVFTDLSVALSTPGPNNDLTDALRDLPRLQNKVSFSVGPILAALSAAQPSIAFARPYTPDLLGAVTKLGQVTAYYDANGHYARVQSANLDLFDVDQTTNELVPIPPEEQFTGLDFGLFTRCPGGATQAVPGSNPFTDNGALLSGGQPPNPQCEPSDVPPGP